jgi:hypothetical protein
VYGVRLSTVLASRESRVANTRLADIDFFEPENIARRTSSGASILVDESRRLLPLPPLLMSVGDRRGGTTRPDAGSAEASVIG